MVSSPTLYLYICVCIGKPGTVQEKGKIDDGPNAITHKELHFLQLLIVYRNEIRKNIITGNKKAARQASANFT
jgi:hypothetical protein